ncbi:MAG: hypothetical protein C6I05_05525, partial [Epsilonproteobacteria bacterium]|nr:hypothetical protein [Campylobacterota bacterium]
MLMAIVFIMALATIAALIISLQGTTTQKTTDVFLHNQAKLIAKSATGYAILAISAHSIKDNGNCIKKIDLTFNKIYDVHIAIRYLGSDFPSSCPMLDNSIETRESNATAIIDVLVEVNDPTFPPVTYVRRSLQ